jgi:hypothetical protein
MPTPIKLSLFGRTVTRQMYATAQHDDVQLLEKARSSTTATTAAGATAATGSTEQQQQQQIVLTYAEESESLIKQSMIIGCALLPATATTAAAAAAPGAKVMFNYLKFVAVASSLHIVVICISAVHRRASTTPVIFSDITLCFCLCGNVCICSANDRVLQRLLLSPKAALLRLV